MISTALPRLPQPLAGALLAAAPAPTKPAAGAAPPASQADGFSRLLEQVHTRNADGAAKAPDAPQPQRNAAGAAPDTGAGSSGTQAASAADADADADTNTAGTAPPAAGEAARKSPKPLVRPLRPTGAGSTDAGGKPVNGSCTDPAAGDGKTADAGSAAADATERKPGDPATDPAALLASLAAAARASGTPPPQPAAPGVRDAKASDASAATAKTPRAAADRIGTTEPVAPEPAIGTPVQATPAADDMPVDFPAQTALLSGPAGPKLPLEIAATAALPLAAAVAGGAAPAAAADAAPATGSLAASPGSAEFAPQLGAQISTFVRNGVQHARLELNPAEMGPLTVQIRLDGLSAQLAGQAAAMPIEVHLAAEHTATRQALEQAMPALASSLREAGLTLSGGGVFEQPRQQPQPGSGNGDGTGRSSSRGDVALPDERTPPGLAGASTGWQGMRQRGVVDLVA